MLSRLRRKQNGHQDTTDPLSPIEIEKFQENPARHLSGTFEPSADSEDEPQHHPSQNMVSSPASRGASTFDPEKLYSDSPSPSSDQTLPYEPGSWYLAVAGLCLTFITGFVFIGFAIHLTRNTRIAEIDAIFGDTGVWFVKFSSTRRSLIDLGERLSKFVSKDANTAFRT